ncbi:MAG: hypothetical protein IKM49_04580, partial [Ruminococcus sp.]|nr:hypothetical protein [Ruminococcus sp.]
VIPQTPFLKLSSFNLSPIGCTHQQNEKIQVFLRVYPMGLKLDSKVFVGGVGANFLQKGSPTKYT